MSFEQNIKQWVLIDNEMKELQDKLKQLREKKSEITDVIEHHIEDNDLTNTSVKLTDGQLKFVKTKETQPLTFKHLETCLGEIIKNEEQVKKIVEYIKNKREVKYVCEIKRSYNK